MSTLVAIGYPDETTAAAAAEEARRLAADLIIEPEAIAVISRDAEGKFQVSTSHHAVGGGASYGMIWGFYSDCCSSSRSSAWQSAPGSAR